MSGYLWAIIYIHTYIQRCSQCYACINNTYLFIHTYIQIMYNYCKSYRVPWFAINCLPPARSSAVVHRGRLWDACNAKQITYVYLINFIRVVCNPCSQWDTDTCNIIIIIIIIQTISYQWYNDVVEIYVYLIDWLIIWLLYSQKRKSHSLYLPCDQQYKILFFI